MLNEQTRTHDSDPGNREWTAGPQPRGAGTRPLRMSVCTRRSSTYAAGDVLTQRKRDLSDRLTALAGLVGAVGLAREGA